MKKINSLLYVLLAVCMLVAMLPVGVSAEGSVSNAETLDFVLVLDCSGTMNQNDPNGLALTACKMFVDMLPVDNARIGVVALGYTDNTRGYDYSSDYKVEYNNRMIHNIVPLASTEKDAEKDNFKRAISDVGKKDGQQTPIAHGLAAAVDILTQNNASDDNACIILLSDGVMISGNADESNRLLDQSTAVAKTHGWPMFCIELDYYKRNLRGLGEGVHANELLDKICMESGAGAKGRMRVDTPADIVSAFWGIFARFMQGDNPVVEPVQTDGKGVAKKTFEIHELASETNIIVYGGGIEKLELVYKEDNNTKYEIVGDRDFGNIKATYEPGAYYCVKMILPSAGNWEVLAYGDPDAEILINESPIYEADLKMLAKPSREGILHRDDTIAIDAYLSYRDQPMVPRDFYKEAKAQLEIFGSDKEKPVKVFDLEGTENGYQHDLKVGDVPSGKFSVRVVVKHNKFRNGQQESGMTAFESENLNIAVINTETTAMKTYINSEFDALDVNEIFQNPDGDEIIYELSSRLAKFDYELSETGFLTIKSGFVPGVHSVELLARDADMETPVSHVLSLEVVDRPMKQSKIKTVKVFTDRYGFQKDAPGEVVLDLNEYFSDPDGVEIAYTVQNEENEYYAVKQDGSVLHLEALAEGEATFLVTASDKVSELTAEIEVVSKSGKAEFWAKNWIWFALTGGLIALIIIIIIFISKNTKVKGTWDITFEEFGNEAVAEVVSIGVLSVGRKKVFKLKALVDEVGRFVDDPTGVMAHVPNYFMDKDACTVELKGVPFGKGFIVQKVPANSTAVTVEYMGKKVVKNARVTTGTLVFRLSAPGAFGADEEMNITLQSR